jgi:hypothetical protein
MMISAHGANDTVTLSNVPEHVRWVGGLALHVASVRRTADRGPAVLGILVGKA